MVKLFTEPKEVSAANARIFSPEPSNTGAMIASLGNAATQIYGTYRGAKDKAFIGDVHRQLSNLSMERIQAINSELTASGQPVLSDGEISSFNKSVAEAALLDKMKLQRRNSQNYHYRLVAAENAAINANPRLAPEIREAFRQSTGTSSGVLANSMIEDQAGLEIAQKELEFADPDTEREAEIQGRKKVEDYYLQFHPVSNNAPYEEKEKFYLQANKAALDLEQARLQAQMAKNNAAAQGPADEMVMFRTHSALWVQAGGIVDSILNKKYAPDERVAAVQNTVKTFAGIREALTRANGVGRTTLLNAVWANYESLQNMLVRHINGEEQGDVVRTIFQTNKDWILNDFNTSTTDGVTNLEIKQSLELAQFLPGLAEIGRQNPAVAGLLETAGLAAFGSTKSPEAFNRWMAGMPSSERPKNIDKANEFILKLLSNEEGMKNPDQIKLVNNLVSNMYETNFGEKEIPLDKVIALGPKAIELYGDPKFIEYLSKYPSVGYNMDRAIGTYAQKYNEAINETVMTALGQEISGELGTIIGSGRIVEVGDRNKESNLAYTDFISVEATDSGIFYWKPVYSTVSQVEKVIRDRASDYISKAPAGDKAILDRQIKEASVKIHSKMMDLSSELTQKYGTLYTRMAQARQARTGDTRSKAIEHIINNRYIFEPVPEKPQTPSKTQ